LIHNGLLFFITDKTGIASCVNAANGKLVWRERVGGTFSASPIATKEHLYFFDRLGTTTVIALGDQYQVISRNKLESGCMATPALADDMMYLRTTSHLYGIK
jgi:outer membrane protein assembly factor BamB